MSKEKKKDLCGGQDWQVLIPYKDLEKMVDSLKSYEELQAEYLWTKKEIKALRSLLTETWQKIGEINKML